MRFAPLAATALLLAMPTVAQMPTTPPGAPDPARVKPGTYQVEPGHSQVLFGVDHLGFTNYFGMFSGVSGTLTIDPAKPASAVVDVTIQVATVKTSSAKLDEELVSPQFFDAAKFPTMRFRSTKVTIDPRDARQATVAGELTLHGVTRPVTVEARFHGAGANMRSKGTAIGFEGRARVKRSEFGVTYGVPIVGDEVTVIIAAAFEKPD